jgi:hypothetical protein
VHKPDVPVTGPAGVLCDSMSLIRGLSSTACVCRVDCCWVVTAKVRCRNNSRKCSKVVEVARSRSPRRDLGRVLLAKTLRPLLGNGRIGPPSLGLGLTCVLAPGLGGEV